MFKLIFIIFFNILILTVESKRVNLLKPFTVDEISCPVTPVVNSICNCNLNGSNSNNWIYYDEKINLRFRPDVHNYQFFQMSSIIDEPSTDGFILISDRFDCPGNVDSCEMTFPEPSEFGVTSNYEKIKSMTYQEWNKLLQRDTPSPTLKTSYKCIFQANQSGYLSIYPLVEKVLGWAYNYTCNTFACGLPHSHPCRDCPKIMHSQQKDCTWLGKVPKINNKDGNIIGDRLCVTAKDEDDALQKLANLNTKSESIRLPIKIDY